MPRGALANGQASARKITARNASAAREGVHASAGDQAMGGLKGDSTTRTGGASER